MSGKSLAAAIVGGVVGVAIWASALAILNREFGIVAWLIGGMVGGLSAWAGGRGVANGLACALIALVAIFGGKWFGVQWSVSKLLEEQVTYDVYEEQREDARRYAALGAPAAHASFMVDRGYTDAASASAVSERELASFRADTGPWLERFEDEDWSYDEYVASMTADVDWLSAVREDLGILDLVFLALGVGTALKLGGRLGEDTGPDVAGFQR